MEATQHDKLVLDLVKYRLKEGEWFSLPGEVVDILQQATSDDRACDLGVVDLVAAATQQMRIDCDKELRFFKIVNTRPGARTRVSIKQITDDRHVCVTVEMFEVRGQTDDGASHVVETRNYVQTSFRL